MAETEKPKPRKWADIKKPPPRKLGKTKNAAWLLTGLLIGSWLSGGEEATESAAPEPEPAPAAEARVYGAAAAPSGPSRRTFADVRAPMERKRMALNPPPPCTNPGASEPTAKLQFTDRRPTVEGCMAAVEELAGVEIVYVEQDEPAHLSGYLECRSDIIAGHIQPTRGFRLGDQFQCWRSTLHATGETVWEGNFYAAAGAAQAERPAPYTIVAETDSSFGTVRSRVTIEIEAPTASSERAGLEAMMAAAIARHAKDRPDAVSARLWENYERDDIIQNRIIYAPDGCGWTGDDCSGEIWTDLFRGTIPGDL